jgi:hypothetical protein
MEAVPEHRVRQPEQRVQVVGGAEVPEGRPELGQEPVDQRDPARRFRALGQGAGLLGLPQHVAGMAALQLQPAPFGFESLATGLAQHLQQRVAGRRRRVVVVHDQRLLDQRPQQSRHPLGVELLVSGDSHGVVGGERPGEDREPGEQTLLVGRQQLVGPLDERLERAVAGLGRPASAGEQLDVALHRLQHLG